MIHTLIKYHYIMYLKCERIIYNVMLLHYYIQQTQEKYLGKI